MSRYTDEDGNLLRGSYKGEPVPLVADEDPEYLQWLLEEGDIDAEDREVIQTALGLDNEAEEE
jgi:hypothetical protein